MLFIQADNFDENVTSKFSDSISILFEEMFFPASNSNSHFIVNEEDLKQLKFIVQSHSDSTDSIIKSLLENNQLKTDSLLISNRSIDSLSLILNEKLLVENKDYQIKQASFFGRFLLIATLLTMVFFLSTLYFRIRAKYRYNFESLAEVEKNFDTHKKAAIERERKLLRELIDLKNKLETKV
ncbi:hypothetical protein [Cognataquiflexum nitidum]|uniref:hypothetical protein n=1 Tax=Cognataquiflexum nitidum TaxID=2922272 RepID=UPI001F13BE98|nr:hypothetical protein [Cognataquiflexum nitidum]